MRKRYRIKNLFAWVLSLAIFIGTESVFAFFQAPTPNLTTPPPTMKVHALTEKLSVTPTRQNMITSGDFSKLSPLYDQNEKTIGGSDTPVTVTLDLGTPTRLYGVRFLPGKEARNRCLGTKFSVSKNNRNYTTAAILNPIDETDLSAQWHELSFGGSSEVRYLRVDLPAGAYFSEIEWLAFSDWTYTSSGGNLTFSLGLQAYDIQETFEGAVLAAVYTKDGILKQLEKSTHLFTKDTPTPFQVTISNLRQTPGDYYRFLIFEPDGSSAVLNSLTYYDNDGSPQFAIPNLFSDNMLLQANKPLTIWGNAPTGSKVRITLENQNGGKAERETIAKEGSFSVQLGSFTPGGTYRLLVQCGSEQKVFHNITFGDIWLCIGQSNMDYYMLGGQDTISYLESEQGKAEVNNPNIRLLNLWNRGINGSGGSVEQLPLPYGHNAWVPMDIDAANYCSAVGYFVAQELEQTYHTPIGLLSVAVGDTEINRWIPYGSTYQSFTSTDGSLFYNRVAPFEKLQIKGLLMYQGEADQYRTELSTEKYRDAMTGLVNHYRKIWGDDIPFYWAQLTRYQKDESAIREGQRLALSQIKNQANTGVISLIDVYGEYEPGAGNCREDIHPHQKQVVADRFLNYIKRDVYGEDIAASGPVYQSMRVIGNAIELTFQTTGDLKLLPVSQYADRKGQEYIKQMKINTNIPQEFEIAGSNGKFVKADAKIQGNKIILRSNAVPNPQKARYAWGAYPEVPNLTDDSGLPALSFSTHLY